MTNYNERLGEILETLNNKAREERASCTERNNWEGYNFAYEGLEREAKQAITSLTKELVAEAEPVNKQGEIDIDEPAYNDGYWSGAYNALEKFKQNLLKALEEV